MYTVYETRYLENYVFVETNLNLCQSRDTIGFDKSEIRFWDDTRGTHDTVA